MSRGRRNTAERGHVGKHYKNNASTRSRGQATCSETQGNPLCMPLRTYVSRCLRTTRKHVFARIRSVEPHSAAALLISFHRRSNDCTPVTVFSTQLQHARTLKDWYVRAHHVHTYLAESNHSESSSLAEGLSSHAWRAAPRSSELRWRIKVDKVAASDKVAALRGAAWDSGFLIRCQ